MPQYEYCNFKGECFDRIFYHWSDAPQTIVEDSLIYRRQFPAPTVKFVGSFSGGTPQRHISQGHVEKGSGQKVVEDGMDRDVKRKKQERVDKQDRERKEFVASQLETYDV
jgi:hypothetical protein